VGFNHASEVWQTVSIPATGDWQNWTTVSFPATLGAGVQQLTVLANTAGYNLNFVNVVSGSAPVQTSGSGIDLPVLEWNIQINDSSVTHAQIAMDQAMAVVPRPQILVIEEGWLAHLDDYLNELEAQTGQTWYGAFATHCPLGDWNGTACTVTPSFPLMSDQGVGIFSTFPIINSSSILFPFADCYTSARAGLHAAIDVNGTAVQVFATHLQTGGCANDALSRYNSIAMLKTWAGGYPAPWLAAGDFNATPDQIDTTQGMLPSFVDAWSVVGSGPGYTWPSIQVQASPIYKIDYWFSDSSGTAQPISSEVVTSTGATSDHYPVATMFQIQ
jgi:endonuclease/exonuclease/phosphatase family metal-dependent hydrolase